MSDAKERWLEETEAAWLYGVVAEAERHPRRHAMFLGLREATARQAGLLALEVQRAGGTLPTFRPTLRLRIVAALTRRFGPRACAPLLAACKVRGLGVYRGGFEDGHPTPTDLEEEAKRHAGRGSAGNLRAAVFGVNDGLVSNASLILGMAGATADEKVVVTSGVAGLLAGAFSMAAGEWVSVRSQRELHEHQIAQERDELERYPEEEAEELALIHVARGLPRDEARVLARRQIADPERALATLAREELGLDPEDLGSPTGAAISSFLAFAGGAALPLVPFLVPGLEARLPVTIGLSGTALFGVGAALSLFSGRSAWWGGARMLLIGVAAGGVTWLIGSAIGVSLG